MLRRAGERPDHHRASLLICPERQRHLVLVARTAPDGAKDDVVHAGDHPRGVVITGFHRGDVAAADRGDLVAGRFDELLVLLRHGIGRYPAASGAESSAAQLG